MLCGTILPSLHVPGVQPDIVIIIVDTLVSPIELPPLQNGHRHFSPLILYTLNKLLFLPDCSEDLILNWRLH